MKDYDHDGMIDRPVRTGELTDKIWHRFGAGYVRLTQVRAATGWADMNTADMMVMGEWPSTGNVLHGFEVKVSRSDWLNEVKNPHKNDSVKSYCDFWWLVIADESMVKEGELPDDWGMMVYDGPGRKLRTVKKAPKLSPVPMDNVFVASLLRHNDKESIPIDLHKELLKDERLHSEAMAKKKCEDLYRFVSGLGKEFGIKITEQKEADYTKKGAPKRYVKWLAEMKRSFLGKMDAEQLVRRLQDVQRYDQMLSHVEWAKNKIQPLLKEIENEPDNPTRIWLEWALRDCNAILNKEEKTL